MRLLDRLLSEGFDAGSLPDKTAAIELLTRSQIVVADNVADYWLKYRNDDLPTTSDFPNVMLPFEYTFLEMRFSLSTEIGKHLETSGILLNMRELSHPHPDTEMNGWLNGPNVKYHLSGLFFFQPRGRRPFVMSLFTIPVDAQGCLIANPDGKRCDFSIQPLRFLGVQLEGKSETQLHVDVMTSTVYPALLALSFMHCRNVKVVEEIPPPKLSKKHERKGHKPLLRYHVLKIDHMKSVLEREGHASTVGLKQALHICRGHFATYGKDGKGKLFGKHEGRFWFPDHLRGNPVHGVVDKAYDVR